MVYLINRDFQGPGEQYGGGSLPGIGAGVLTGLAGVYDTYQRHRDVKSEQEARKKEAELAYQRSVEMWHMQNAYNTPAMQMQRFGAAGLNPHLIYGQGSSGQAGTPPQYQPPEISMRGMHAPYGGAVQSLIPTLMAVGSWMQNMRLTETEIQSKETGIDKTEQLIEYLRQRNPMEITKLDNILKLAPYQRSIQQDAMVKSSTMLNDLQQMFRVKYGDDLYRGLEFRPSATQGDVGGLMRSKLAEAAAAARLRGHQADWFEPGMIMKLVLGGVLGMTGVGRVLGGRAVGRTAGRARGFSPKKITNRYDSKGRRVYQRVE